MPETIQFLAQTHTAGLPQNVTLISLFNFEIKAFHTLKKAREAPQAWSILQLML